jgi:SAM-dependent methyltransferase
MNKPPYARALARVERHYARMLRKHGDTPEAAQWVGAHTRTERFRVLTDIGVEPDAKVLDFGCGTGEFLPYLRSERGFEGEYVGMDITGAAVAEARKKFPGVRFERRDILLEGLGEDFDHVFVSGVFNNLLGPNESLMQDLLRLLYRHTSRCLAFNALSSWVEDRGAGLYYCDPLTVFRFCRDRLEGYVALRHDYSLAPGTPPYDFTVYVCRR